MTSTKAIGQTYSGTTCKVCRGGGKIWETRDVPGYGLADFVIPCPVCGGSSLGQIRRERANIKSAFYHAFLHEFDWGVYLDDKQQPIDLSEMQTFVQTFVDNWAAWRDEGKGFYIWSRMRGSGKTFLTSCLCNEVMERERITAKFVSASELVTIAKSADKTAVDEYQRDPVSIFQRCALLAIDDLGQTQGEWLQDILFRIFDARMNDRLPTLVTSNVPISELPFDDRITDRLQKMCFTIKLPDCCVRSKEAFAEKKAFLQKLGVM